MKSERVRTIEALVADANASSDPALAARDLLSAAKQASTSHDWQTILDGIPAMTAPELKRRLIASALVSARAKADVWIDRHVAIFQAQQLHDRVAAAETLREAERSLLALEPSAAPGFLWGVLATAHRLALQDDVAARRLLEAGWALAWKQRDVENLGRLASQWHALDPAEGLTRLRSVEDAAAGWGNLGSVIHWWHTLGDAESGNRLREKIVHTTTRFAEARDLVAFWNLYEKDSPGIEAALGRAEALAETASEWLELATRASRDRDASLRRRALDRAAVIADTPEIKAQIAAAYVDWFADAAAADRVGPRGLRPQDLRPRLSKLEGWSSSATDLFDRLRSRVTPESLARIAAADYGMDAAEHRAALETICSTGFVPLRLAWHPGEVVELTRWSIGDAVEHFDRALSCVLVTLGNPDDELANTGPPLVESCLALGEDFALAVEQFLVWAYESHEADAPESLIALVLLAIARAARFPGDPRLDDVLQELETAPAANALPEWIASSLRLDVWTSLLTRASSVRERLGL